mgnify:CR=1 FL=1
MSEPELIKINGKLFERIVIKVDPNQTTIRIDKFLFDKLENVSRSKIQSGINDQLVLVNEKEIKSNYKIRPNDSIELMIPRAPREEEWCAGEEMDLDIRYEDEDVMVLYKKPGLVVHPGKGNRTGTLVNGLVHYLSNSELPVMPGNDLDRPGIVHRIDKNTSGLLVVAKTELAMSKLAKQFFDHSIEREYVALVWGTPDPEKGTITGNIGRHPKDRLRRFVFEDGDEGKHAVTHYEVEESYYYVSLVKCKLETGRTHQIRVHMAHIGCPLFNDEKYGGDKIRKGTVFSKYKQFVNNNFNVCQRHALHARSLGFSHPRTNEKVFIEAEIPQDMQDVIKRWKEYATTQRSKKI